MNKQLTILISALDADGHVNACIGIGQRLRQRGHSIVFVANESYRERLSAYDFQLELTVDELKSENVNSAEHMAAMFMSTGLISAITPFEKMQILANLGLDFVGRLGLSEPFIKRCVEQTKPDIIVVDNNYSSPSLVHSGKPWVRIISTTLLYDIDVDLLPPTMSGLPTNGCHTEWTAFRTKYRELYRITKSKFDKWYEESGYPVIEADSMFLNSPYLNIYDYPEELAYTDIRPDPPNYCRVDYFMRTESGSFEIPEVLTNKTGKLIYLSMGSLGSANIEMMKRLVEILAFSPNRFIVSKGPLHYMYDLPDNMWGEKCLPQTLILPLVDLVITHGGNNTVTETCYFGKPMIVMPLFADQFDNAQRVMEKGYGIRVDPHLCAKHELLEAIERLLNDDNLKCKLNLMSSRIKESNRLDSVLYEIEKLAIEA